MPDEVDHAVEPLSLEQPPGQSGAVVSLDDPRALQILSAEHWSLLSARSLAYNEAFTRGGMFLAFLSMSFVALALIAQALPLDRDFLSVAALVLAFDLVVGLTTYGRIIAANYEDYIAVHGMNRIRHGYGEIAPVVLPYFTSSTHDDLRGVMVAYGSPPTSGPAIILYGLTTSAGMTALIVSMIGGVLALVTAFIIGTSILLAFGVAVVAGLGAFIAQIVWAYRFYAGKQAALQALFPSPQEAKVQASDSR
jgi:hypothetical protein